MVGYRSPCPCCGNKRRGSLYQRWDSCPLPRSPPPALLPRSISAPVAASPDDVAPNVSDRPAEPATSGPAPQPAVGPVATSPDDVALNVSNGPAPRHPFAAAPDHPTVVGADPPASLAEQGTTKTTKTATTDGCHGDEVEGEEEEEEKKRSKKKRVVVVKLSGGEELKVCIKCPCGSSQELTIPP